MAEHPAVALHVGAHKTATTHLQQAIRAQRRALLAQGVGFFGPPHFRSHRFPFREVMAWRGAPEALRARHAPGLVGRHARLSRLVLSEENILGGAHDDEMFEQGRFYPRAGARLARFMAAAGAERVTLFLAVRDPASFLLSAYSQKLLSGSPLAFDSFIGALAPVRLSWLELLARLLAVPGVAHCVVWRFEDYPAVAGEVLDRMLAPAGAVRVPLPEQPAHQGLSARAQAHVMAWLQAGACGDAAGIARAARARFPKSSAEPGFAPLDAATLAATARAYGHDLDRIAALPRVTLLRA